MESAQISESPTLRKIVSIDEAKPRTAKGRKAKLLAAVAVMVLAAVALAVLLGTAGSAKVPVIKGATLATVAKGDFTKTTQASGTVVVPAEIAVPAPETGYAKSLLVAEGDMVAKGAVLATLSVPALVDAEDDYTASLAAAKVAILDLENDYDYQIATLATTGLRLDAQMATAAKAVETQKALLALRSSKQADYDAAVEALTTLRQKREDATAGRENAIRKKELASRKQQATIDQLQASLDRTKASIEAARIKAPMAGEVLSIAAKLSVAGSLVTENDTLMTIADLSGTFVDFEVDEQYVSLLKVGDSLSATIGTRTVSARIVSLGRVASLSSDGLTATVTVRTKPEGNPTLTPGASAVATITLGTKAGALILPRGAWLTTGGQKYAYRLAGTQARKTAVELGEIQGNAVEVTKGLSAGDRIVVSGYSDFIDSDLVEIK